MRRPSHQVVACPGCGRAVFVFPLSPLPQVRSAEDAPLPAVGRPSPWLYPALGAGITLFIVVVGFAAFIASYVPGQRIAEPTAASAADVRAGWERGRQLLAVADFAPAARELEAAHVLAQRHPQLLSPPEQRRLANLQREAALLADWPGKPLEQTLAGMAALDADQWQTLARGYRGKAVFFDAEVSRDLALNTFRLEHRRPAVGQVLRLDLQSLKLLQRLSLNGGRRVIFGARVADLRRDPAGPCAVILQPDSGVLLTDADAASQACFQPIDAELRAVVDRQAAWVGEGP